MSKVKTTAKSATKYAKPVTKTLAPVAAAKGAKAKTSVVASSKKMAKLPVSEIEMEEAPKMKSKLSSKVAARASAKSENTQVSRTPVKHVRTPFQPSADGKLYGEIEIENNELERFENRTMVRRYTVEFTCPEFTCVCPRSGFPDFATIRIKYVPDRYCVELKSLKLYMNGFRNEKVFHEDVTNNIIQDMIDLLDPHEVEVIGDFTVRGNIHTVVSAKHVK